MKFIEIYVHEGYCNLVEKGMKELKGNMTCIFSDNLLFLIIEKKTLAQFKLDTVSNNVLNLFTNINYSVSTGEKVILKYLALINR